MIDLRTTITRIAGALLVSLALFGCDSTNPVAGPDSLQDAAAMQAELEASLELGDQRLPAQASPVDIENIYSGPPPWSPGVISLDDEYVYVEIFNIEQYLGRAASPSDVRIGDDWETGTPAESFQILDINNDGNRDIRLRFDLQQLVDDGHLTAGVTELEVWGRDPTTGEEFMGSEEVVVGDPEADALTTAPSNNGSGGIFMDLTPSAPLRVTSFETPFGGAVGTVADVQVWTRPGSYVGNDGDPTGWTLTQTVQATRQGTLVNAAIVLEQPLTLPANQTTAVYLQVVSGALGGGIRYTGTAANPPQTTWSNADLTLFSDVARTGTVPFGGSRFTPRTFSGNVNYLVIRD